MHPHLHRFALTALLAWGTAATAAPVQLAGQAPYALDINGVQADAGTGSYQQAFTAPGNATLDKIVWWGYRIDPLGSGDPDDFEVAIDGVAKTGSLTVEVAGTRQNFLKYTLDIADEALAAGGTLSIVQNAPSFEWYWQGTGAAAYVDQSPFAVAYSLLGTAGDGTVPEPGSLALVGLAGLAWAASRRRPRV